MPSQRASSASLPASISKGRAGLAFVALRAGRGDPAQVAAVGGFGACSEPDQRLAAALQLPLEAGEDRLPVGAVLLRLGLVAADDVAPARVAHLLGEELGLGAVGALDQQGG
jgi:hypothetical protein